MFILSVFFSFFDVIIFFIIYVVIFRFDNFCYHLMFSFLDVIIWIVISCCHFCMLSFFLSFMSWFSGVFTMNLHLLYYTKSNMFLLWCAQTQLTESKYSLSTDKLIQWAYSRMIAEKYLQLSESLSSVGSLHTVQPSAGDLLLTGVDEKCGTNSGSSDVR